MNALFSMTMRWNGTEVIRPSMRISSSACAMRMIASDRFRPQATSLATNG